jgi:hypothetical protein
VKFVSSIGVGVRNGMRRITENDVCTIDQTVRSHPCTLATSKSFSRRIRAAPNGKKLFCPARTNRHWRRVMTVTVWMCPCGTEYKIISEVGSQTPLKTSVVCPRCQAVTNIDGTPLERLEAAGEDKWRTVGTGRT